LLPQTPNPNAAVWRSQAAEGEQGEVAEEVKKVVNEVSAVLDRYFPLKSSGLKTGFDEHCHFVLMFQVPSSLVEG
jgi:hypothetical protein